MMTDRQDEIAASVGALRDLGPGYDQALAEGLVERIGAEIDKRIAAAVEEQVEAEMSGRVLHQLDRYAGCRHQRRRARRMLRADRASRAPRSDRTGFGAVVLALGSMIAAILATLTVFKLSPWPVAMLLTVLIWIVIGVMNVASGPRRSQPR